MKAYWESYFGKPYRNVLKTIWFPKLIHNYTPVHLIESVENWGLCMRQCLASSSYVHVMHFVLAITRAIGQDASVKHWIMRNCKLLSLPLHAQVVTFTDSTRWTGVYWHVIFWSENFLSNALAQLLHSCGSRHFKTHTRKHDIKKSSWLWCSLLMVTFIWQDKHGDSKVGAVTSI